MGNTGKGRRKLIQSAEDLREKMGGGKSKKAVTDRDLKVLAALTTFGLIAHKRAIYQYNVLRRGSFFASAFDSPKAIEK